MADGDIGKIYGRLDDHDHRITALESTRPFLQDLIARSVKSNEVLAQTMQDVQLSIVKLNDKMDAQAEEIKSMKTNSEMANRNMNDKLTAVETKVSALEDAGKFDIRAWIKKNWPWLCVMAGLGIMYASQYVKF